MTGIEAALKNLIEHLDQGGYRPYTDDCLMCGARSGPCDATCPTEVARKALLDAHPCPCGRKIGQPHDSTCPDRDQGQP